MVRLIRSKGVGVYFITQNPTDIPESILGQLGNRVQHALRAYTPKDQKAVRSAAETFRANPAFKTEDAIMELETGEALVSFLDPKGAPSVVQRAKILFPLSQIGPITPGQRLDIQNASPVGHKYDEIIDRESAFEVLLAESEKVAEEAAQAEVQAEAAKPQKEEKKAGKAKKGIIGKVLSGIITAIVATIATAVGALVGNKISGKKSKTTSTKSVTERAVKNATSSVVRTVSRSVLGSLIK